MCKRILKVFVLGILAGFCISLGGIFNVYCVTYIPNGYGKIVGSLLFSIGLMLICFFGLNLYTGKIGYVLKNKNYIDLLIMLIGNIAGTLLIGYLMYAMDSNNEKVMSTIVGIATKKIEMDNIKMFISALLCGTLVYIAVDSFKKVDKTYKKIIVILVPIALFVFLGYDHCIANCFYYSFANKWSIPTVVSLFSAIFGNSVGSILTYSILKEKNESI